MAWRCDGCGGEHLDQPAEELQRTICRHYMRFCSPCVERGITKELQMAKPCDTCADRAQRNGGSK